MSTTTNTNQPSSTPLLSGTYNSTTAARMQEEKLVLSLQRLKWINLLAYLVNCIVTYAIGAFGSKFGLPTNAELSAKYQTLITPAGFTFAIWGVIFLLQLVWVIYQFVLASRLAKAERTTPISTVTMKNLYSIVDGIGYNYIWIVLTQVTWTIAFTAAYIGLSVIAISSILLALIVTTRNLYASAPVVVATAAGSSTNATRSSCRTCGCAGCSCVSNYLLAKAPFTIHCGWVAVATIVNISLWMVYKNYSSSVLYYTAISSLLLVAFIGTVLIYNKYITVPIVLIWALYGIESQVKSADNAKIIESYSTNQISTIATITNSIMIYIGTGLVLRQIVALYHCNKNKN